MVSVSQSLLVVCVHTVLSLLGGRGVEAGGPRGNQCPRACFCNTESRIVYCSRRGLRMIPSAQIPHDSLQLNLNSNMFGSTRLQRSNVSSLVSLEHLYMSECGIETIEADTFRDLVNLEWLDLSNNRIRLLQDFTFRGLTLQHLFINGNRNIQLGPLSFGALATTGLYMHDCSLSSLSHRVLAPLNDTLRNLWLNDNELEHLDKHLAPMFSRLTHLRLGANPLHCNCKVAWLKDFFDRHQEVFAGADEPSCLTPHLLRGQYFRDLTVHDLRCQAPVFGNIEVAFEANTRARLKCSASGDPAPTLYWIQPSGRATKYPASTEEEVKRTEGVLTAQGPGLAGMYFCVANNDGGNVTLTINVTLPACHPTVTYHTATDPCVNHTATSAPSSTSSPQPRDGRDRDLIKIQTTLPIAPSSDRAPAPKPNDTPANQANRTGDNSPGTTTTTTQGFTLAQLLGAIIGTHLCTLILCLIFIPLYFRRKYESRPRHPPLDKPLPPIPPETRYLNGLGHHPLSYMDLLPSKG